MAFRKANIVNIRRGLKPSRLFKNTHTTPNNLASNIDLLIPDAGYGEVEANSKVELPQIIEAVDQGFNPHASDIEGLDDWVVDQNGGTGTNTGTLTEISTTIFQTEAQIITAGTELVFIGGVLQSEGSGNDYTVDASSGLVTLGSTATGNVIVASCPTASDTLLNIDQSDSGATTGTLSGSINGVNTVFTLSEPYVSGKLLVVVGGITQFQGSGSSGDYVETSPDAGTFTMNVAPATGTNMLVISKPQGRGRRYEDTNHTLDGRVNGSNTLYTTTKPFKPSSVGVFVNGMMQQQGSSADYVVTSTTEITMNVAPAADSVVGVGYEVNDTGTADGYTMGRRSGVFAYLTSPSNTTCTLADTWYPIAGAFTNNPMLDFSFVTDHIEYDGTLKQYFEIDWHATIEGDSNGITAHIGIYLNSSIVASSVMGVFLKYSGEVMTLSGTCVVEMEQGDEIQLVAMADGAGDVITVKHFTTTIARFFI